jgi:RNA methyltransferase, TrmH family
MLSHNKNKFIRALHSRKGRDQHGACLLEGERSILSALFAGATLEVVVHTSALHRSECVQKAHEATIPVVEVDDREMIELSDVRTPPGVLAVAKSPLVDAESLIDLNSVVILDCIQDPGNAGTIIRTAAWFGIDAVLAGNGTVDLLSPKVVRSTMGGMWDLNLARIRDIPDWVTAWKMTGGSVVAADMRGKDLHEWKPAKKTALVIGSEANGLSQTVQDLVDLSIFIGRPNGSDAEQGVESLNASIAAGIMMSNWRRHG